VCVGCGKLNTPAIRRCKHCFAEFRKKDGTELHARSKEDEEDGGSSAEEGEAELEELAAAGKVAGLSLGSDGRFRVNVWDRRQRKTKYLGTYARKVDALRVVLKWRRSARQAEVGGNVRLAKAQRVARRSDLLITQRDHLLLLSANTTSDFTRKLCTQRIEQLTQQIEGIASSKS
jgi:hypothetical protein